jgi:hypothetical protein
MKEILEWGRYIPQEILNNGDFIEMVAGSADAVSGKTHAEDENV